MKHTGAKATGARGIFALGFALRFAFALMVMLQVLAAGAASAGEAIRITKTNTALDLTDAATIYADRGPAFKVETAPDAQGIVSTIEVQAIQPQTAGDWAVFVLSNTTSEQLDRLIVAPHFRLVSSGLFWPDLGGQRIVNVTPSEGFSLERVPSRDSDVFAITLNPGAVVTFVAELTSPNLPQLYLWDGDRYEEIVNSYTLYRGIVLGIAGLLALFLTVIFVVRGTSTFPAAAALAWAALGYVIIDFGFIDQFFAMTAADERFWRAISEGAIAATLTFFLFTYLNLNRWSEYIRYISFTWMIATLALSAIAVYNAEIASGIARIAIALTAVMGLGLIAWMSFRRFDRAIMLIPSWLLLIAAIAAGYMTITGRVDNDIIQPALAGALVLVVLLIGFTVMQNAFAGGALQQNLFSNTELQALAVSGSDSIVWNWDVGRDRLTTTPDIGRQIGLSAGAMNGPPKNWLKYLHADDRDHFRTTLDSVLEQRRGRIALDLRLRGEDNHYHWFRLRARPVTGTGGEVIRCIGTLTDVSDQKRSEERMIRDAVHDNLTGLPNRELFLDRVRTTVALAAADADCLPTVFIIDIDRFKDINESIGMSAGDTLLIAVARRLRRLLKPHDTLARIGGDQFGIILVSETEASAIADFAQTLKKTVKVPVSFADSELVLTPSIGLATWSPARAQGEDLFGDAELAVHQAKRFGGDRVEPFRPAYRAADTNKLQLAADLSRAIEREEISLVYQPIVRISDGAIAGFETLMRWSHPRRGEISPSEFIALAERSDLINELGRYALEHALRQLMEWDTVLSATPVFLSVNVSGQQISGRDFAHEVTQLMARYANRNHRLRLEITETAVMRNPEHANHVLKRLRSQGIDLAIDDFGTGYSSLSYLARFPFDTLKIDQSFMRMSGEPRIALLRSITEMAHALGLSVVAEGAESSDEVQMLETLGCDYVQGFAAGKPVSAAEAARMVSEQNPLIVIDKAAE